LPITQQFFSTLSTTDFVHFVVYKINEVMCGKNDSVYTVSCQFVKLEDNQKNYQVSLDDIL